MKTYHTSEIASIIGVHPNTVRFYEEVGLMPKIPRMDNGYRVYSECHLVQLQFIRLAFRAEILSDNLRNEVVDIVKTSVRAAIKDAIKKTTAYQMHIKEELGKAREAIAITERIINGDNTGCPAMALGRREAAALIGISVDILRDWERNGLICVPRKGNRRQYGIYEMNRLKIISILRHANYSQMAIRRMLQKLDDGDVNLISAIDTPEPTEDILHATDCYMTSLSGALQDTAEMFNLLDKLK